MRLPYDIVDVFTDRPYAGNQLAVVHGGDLLTTDQCLAIAQEFGFSETTFPASDVVDGREYATRIFTPGGEVPFAGHPTLGTAWVLHERGRLSEPETTQVCAAGRIGVRLVADLVELTARPRDLEGPVEVEVVAGLLADLGLEPEDQDGEAWTAGCGLTFVHLPVVASALDRATASRRPLRAYGDRLPATDPLEGVNLVHVSGAAPALEVHARVFVPGLSVPEDPATGSAAAGLGIALVAEGWLPEGGRYTIAQGVEMGRPSTLFARVEAVDGRATACHVAGHVQPVASGQITVPALS